MKLHINNVLLLIMLFLCCKISLFGHEIMDINLPIFNKIDPQDYNFTKTTNTEHFTSFISATHENHFVVTENYFNHETNTGYTNSFPIYPDSLNEPQNQTSHFDCNLSPHQDVLQPSHHDSLSLPDTTGSTNYLAEHLKDSAIDQHRQDIENNRLSSLQEQHKLIPNQKISTRLDEICTIDGFKTAIAVPDINAYLQQLSYSLMYEFKEKASTFSRKKTLAQLHARVNFVNAILSGKITELLDRIKFADLAIAEAAFKELKQIWPYDHKRSFLNSRSYSSKEKQFLKRIKINVMKIAERTLITRPDYSAQYADARSLKTIEAHREKCFLMQQQGNRTGLWNEMARLGYRINKRFGKEDFTNKICLAITKDIFVNPVTTIMHIIVHAPSLKEAWLELQNLEIFIDNLAKQKNIVLMSDVKKMLIEEYGFDIQQVAHQHFMDRADYVSTPENRTVFSDPFSYIMESIKDDNLTMAHAELVHLKKQTAEIFVKENITDPIAQQECLIQNFGTDVVADAQNAYQTRSDVLNITTFFNPIDVQSGTLRILETSNTYESVCDGFQILTDQVLDNARLCELKCLPHVENHILDSLHVMRNSQSPAEFVFRTTIVDHVLTDLQCQATAVATGETPAWNLNRAYGVLTIGLVTFFTQLSPIEQAKDWGSLAVSAGSLVETIASKTINRAREELLDPIGTTQEYVAMTANACEYIHNVALGTCDAVSGIYYLPAEERLQRLESSYKAAGEIYKSIESQVTAEALAKVSGKIAADFLFGRTVLKVGTYLNEIKALSKISDEVKVVVRSLKSAVEEHPAFVTAEGIVLKMSDGVNKSNKPSGESIKNSQSFLENAKLGKIKETLSSVNQTPIAVLKDGYYEVNGFKFTEYYYNRLWNNGRGAPSFAAQAILEHATEIIPDPEQIPGFFKYFADGWEMIYNPTTKIVSHIQQIKK